MPQGTRRGWVRAAFAGLGVVLCTGLVGCMNSDKDKFPPKIGANTKQPGPGLPNTVRLPGQPGTGGVGTTGQPNYNGGLQPTGGFGTTGRGSGAPNTFNPGTGLGAGVVPSMNPGIYQPTSGSGFGSAPQPNLGGTPATGGYPTGGSAYPNNPPAVGITDLGPIPPGPPGGGVGPGFDSTGAPLAPAPMIYKGGN